MLHLFNIFHENKDFDNCAEMLEEECIKMFGTKSLNDEHDCNVVSMDSLNIHSTNDDCTSHDENASQVLMCKFIMMIACLLFMMVILMKVGLEECQL